MLEIIERKDTFAKKYERYAEHLFAKTLENENEEPETMDGACSDVEQMGNYVLLLKSLRGLVETMQTIILVVQESTGKPLKNALPKLPGVRDSLVKCYRYVGEMNEVRNEEGCKLGTAFETEVGQIVDIAVIVNRIGIDFDTTCAELKRQCRRRKRHRQKQNALKP